MAGHVDDGSVDGSDYYYVQVPGGHTLIVETHTPADGSGVFVNTLDPMLRLWDEFSSMLASDDNSGKGANYALLQWTAPPGPPVDCFIEITSSPATAPTSGEYVLTSKGQL